MSPDVAFDGKGLHLLVTTISGNVGVVQALFEVSIASNERNGKYFARSLRIRHSSHASPSQSNLASFSEYVGGATSWPSLSNDKPTRQQERLISAFCACSRCFDNSWKLSKGKGVYL